MASKNSNGDSYGKGRTRNYATVVYPESAPENWYEILSEQHISALVSPLHDKDINPTGEPKKAHYHVILIFETVKTKEQAKEIFDTIGGVGCEVVQSTRGYARYLCHLDNPEKYQYTTDDVRSFGGIDYNTMIGTQTDKYKALYEMIDFIEDNNVVSFQLLVRYAMLYRSDWNRVLMDSGTYYIKEYLKSRQWSIENNQTTIINSKTGETLL